MNMASLVKNHGSLATRAEFFTAGKIRQGGEGRFARFSNLNNLTILKYEKTKRYKTTATTVVSLKNINLYNIRLKIKSHRF